MDCRGCREIVSAGLDGETTSEEDALAAAHLARCAGCQLAAEAAAMITRWSRVRVTEPSADLVERVLGAIDSGTGPTGPVPACIPPSRTLHVVGVSSCGCAADCGCGCQAGRQCRCGWHAA